jgi:hypothetical protein
MKNLAVSTFALLVLGSALSVPETDPSALLFTRIEPSLLNPPEYPIAKPLSGGPLRILFLGRRDRVGPVCYGISARLSCTFESVLTESRTVFFGRNGRAFPDSSIVYGRMLAGRAYALLAGEWDAIWLDFRFRDLPDDVRTALMDRVRAGAGLVYVGDGGDLRAFTGRREFDSKRVRAVSYGTSIMAYIGGAGKGHVFALPEIARTAGPLDIGDYLALATHALFLASGRDTRFAVTNAQVPGRKIELESMVIMSFRVDFVNRADAGPRKVKVRYRNERGETAAETEETYRIEKGRGFFKVRYPSLPVGKYSADITVFENEHVISIAGTSFRVHSDESLDSIDMKNRSAAEGEYLTGRVKTSREIREGMSLTIELLDSWGRRISATELIPEPHRLGVDFVFGIRRVSHGVMTIRANLFKSNTLAHIMEEPVFSRSSFDSRIFSLIVYEKGGYDPFHAVGYERLADEGVSALALDMTGLSPGEAFTAAVKGARQGTMVIPVFSPGGRAAGAGSGADGFKRMLAVLDTLGGMDIPTCTLDAIDREAASTNALLSVLVARAGHDSASCISMITRPFRDDRSKASIPGVNCQRTAEAALAESFADFSAPPLISGGCINGILFEDFPRNIGEAEFLSAPWKCLFLGMNSVWWSGGTEGAFPAIMPGFTVNPAFSALAGEARAITGGIDYLLSGANPRFDRIALLWDSDSARRVTGSLHGESRSAFRSARAFYRACMDAGYRPRIITEEMIRRGLLTESDIAVLVLPGMRALSDSAAQAITRFAESGGAVLADLRPGIMDERFTVRANGALDTIFGIEAVRDMPARESEGAVRFFGTERGMPGAFALEGCRGDSGIRPSGDARALGALDDFPAFLMKSAASGRGVCFNFSMELYETLRGSVPGNGLKGFLAWCMGWGGINPPPVAVVDSAGNRAVGVETFLYEDGGALYVGILPDEASHLQECRLSINRFSGEPYLYDVRKGQFRGMTKTAPLELSFGKAELFAILPYRVGDIEVKMASNVVYPGNSLAYQADVLTRNDAKPLRHVLRVEVMGPDGKVRGWLSGMHEPSNGSFKASIPLSSADSPGKWMLRIRDVATGKQTERVFIVMPSPGS